MPLGGHICCARRVLFLPLVRPYFPTALERAYTDVDVDTDSADETRAVSATAD